MAQKRLRSIDEKILVTETNGGPRKYAGSPRILAKNRSTMSAGGRYVRGCSTARWTRQRRVRASCSLCKPMYPGTPPART